MENKEVGSGEALKLVDGNDYGSIEKYKHTFGNFTKLVGWQLKGLNHVTTICICALNNFLVLGVHVSFYKKI